MMPSLRRLLLVLLLLGIVVTGSDLLLLEHYEDRLQLLPIGLLVVGLASVGAHAIRGGTASLKALRWVMVAFLFAGIGGLVLHHRGSREFQTEVNPGLEGFELFWRAAKAKTPPALAPAAMIHLGLLGLAYGFRHPLSSAGADEVEPRSES